MREVRFLPTALFAMGLVTMVLTRLNLQ